MIKVRVDIKVETGVRYVSGFVPDKTKGLFATFLRSKYDPKLTGWSITHRATGVKVSTAPDLKHALSLIMVLENNPKAVNLWRHEWRELKRISDTLCDIVTDAAIRVEKALDEREKT